MYNQEVKDRYVSENQERNTNLKEQMRPRFKKSTEMENRLGKDVATFSKDEILELYKSMHRTSPDSAFFMHSQMQQYAWWYCVNIDESVKNAYLTITKEDILSCIDDSENDMAYITREKLIDIIEDLPNPGDQFVCIALFEGIGAVGNQFEELADLTMDDFDMNHVRLCTGRILEVSPLLVEIAQLASNTVCMKSFGDQRTMNYDASDDRILKRRANARGTGENADMRRILNITVRVREHTGIQSLKSKMLTNSGRIDMLKRLMKEQDMTDPLECLKANRVIIEHRYGKLNSLSKFVNKYREAF